MPAALWKSAAAPRSLGAHCIHIRRLWCESRRRLAVTGSRARSRLPAITGESPDPGCVPDRLPVWAALQRAHGRLFAPLSARIFTRALTTRELFQIWGVTCRLTRLTCRKSARANSDLLRVKGLSKKYVRGRSVAEARAGSGGSLCRFRDSRRSNLRAGRRVGIGKVDGGAMRDSPWRGRTPARS
jgi:hypothetical protein